MRGRAEAARQAHNLEVGGSSPPPATLKKAYSNYYYSCNHKKIVESAISKPQHR